MSAPDLAALALPADPVTLLDGRHPSREIADCLHLAYWLHGRDNGTALYHLTQAHEQLHKLAAALGYTVQRVAE